MQVAETARSKTDGSGGPSCKRHQGAWVSYQRHRLTCLLICMVWSVIALAQCPLSDILEPFSGKEILGDCKRLSSAGIQLASPRVVNACRVRVSQSHQWAYAKAMPRR